MRTLIFGAGDYGMLYLDEASNRAEKEEIIGFVDNDPHLRSHKIFGKYPCYIPDEIATLDYDTIVIALYDPNGHVYARVSEQLSSIGVNMERVKRYPPTGTLTRTDTRSLFIRDYARFIREQSIEGNVAECGVDAGETAKYINRYFYNKTCYLIDSFEGFGEQDIRTEVRIGQESFIKSAFNCTGGWNHSIDTVMNKMTFPEKVVLKKGWVPEILNGIEDTFCFVNLDMDLYQPMIAATTFFWERMSTGGVILLHDYYHPHLPGVRKAVDDFEAALGRRVPKVPTNRSLAIIKD